VARTAQPIRPRGPVGRQSRLKALRQPSHLNYWTQCSRCRLGQLANCVRRLLRAIAKLSMDPFSLKFVAAACGGEVAGDSPATPVLRVCTDSRQVQPGDLFIALAGDRFDGHGFLSEAVRRGAIAVMIDRRERQSKPDASSQKSSAGCTSIPECAKVVVDDTRRALGRLAGEYRKGFGLPVIAVGGSNGKTTTKELLASVLRQKLEVLWSEASFNNDIGVPLTLLRLEKKHQAGVLEVGTNHPGELEVLLGLVQPRYGVITSIGREHLEFFGDMSGVAREEGCLAEMLPLDGKLFLNGDNEWADPVAARSRASVVRAGFGDGNDWRVRSARTDRQGVSFQVEAPVKEFAGEYRIRLLGRHMALNALLAIAVGAELGLSRAEIERGLADCKPARMRLQLWEHNGVHVLDDAYNANADSMVAALQTLQDLPCKGRRVAVLGDMGELGLHSEAAHEEIGRCAAELGVGQLFAVGHMAPVIARGARGAGLLRVLEFKDVETAAAAVKSFVKQGDLILLKGSRAARLERIADSLRNTLLN
jgi:UDP-N-acetylmuramoyl-tripeptide--D-alanyl-D-alanine ligase